MSHSDDLKYLKSIGAKIIYTADIVYGGFQVASSDEQIALVQRGLDGTLTYDDVREIINERDKFDLRDDFFIGKLIRVVRLKLRDKYHTDFMESPSGPCPACNHTDPQCRLCLGQPIKNVIECTCTCECPDCADF
jgi:hypothetical protein